MMFDTMGSVDWVMLGVVVIGYVLMVVYFEEIS